MRGYKGRTARAACVAAFVALAGATPAFSAVELDQNALVVADANSGPPTAFLIGTAKGAPPPLPSPAYSYIVQSATAGKAGYLDHLDVQLVRLNGFLPLAQGTVTLALYDGDLASGTGSLVGSRDIAVDGLPYNGVIPTTFARFDFRDADYLLTSGQVFSFQINFFSTADVSQSIGAVIGNTGSGGAIEFNDYAGGEAHNGGSIYGIAANPLPGDLGFRSFVDVTTGAVPEPASWALMIGGFALAGCAMRRPKVETMRFA